MTMPSFRTLNAGLVLDEPTSTLEIWFAQVFDTPFDALSVGDVCRAIRQSLHLKELLPIAAQILTSDVTAGELFDGELASVVARVPKPFWETNRLLAVEMKKVLELCVNRVDEEIEHEIMEFLEMSKTFY
jgi:CDI immunity proteins